MNDHPQTVICRYTLKPGAEPRCCACSPVLADAAPRRSGHRYAAARFRGLPSTADKGAAPRRSAAVLIEIFAWKTSKSAESAHQSPAVMAIWEPMGALCEAMEFPHFEAVALDFDR
jgi:hypothetical protein